MRSLGVALLAIASLLGRAESAMPSSPGSVAEQYLFAAANAERVQRGLPPLRWDAALYRAAQEHAREMAERESISHQYPGEPDLASRGKLAGARFSTIAENVAEAPTAVDIHEAWMESPGHRENLLSPKVDSIAISVLRRNGQLYAVQDFDRSVLQLSVDDQESQVARLVESVAPLEILPASYEARRTCSMESGYTGQRPGFVMRFTAGDLSRLPDALVSRLRTGRYHGATVAACDATERNFTAFHIAVLLYP
jgi:hypothetical protein